MLRFIKMKQKCVAMDAIEEKQSKSGHRIEFP